MGARVCSRRLSVDQGLTVQLGMVQVGATNSTFSCLDCHCNPMIARRAVRTHPLHLLRLHRTAALGGADPDCVTTPDHGPVVAPQYPSQRAERRHEKSGLHPFSAVHLDLHLLNAPISRPGNATDGHPATHHTVRRHGVNHRNDLRSCLGAPTTFHPVAWPPVINGFDARDPLRLFHPIPVGDVDAKRKAIPNGAVSHRSYRRRPAFAGPSNPPSPRSRRNHRPPQSKVPLPLDAAANPRARRPAARLSNC